MKTYQKTYIYRNIKFEITIYLNYQSTKTVSPTQHHKIVVVSGEPDKIPDFEFLIKVTENLSDRIGSTLHDIQNKVDKYVFDNQTVEGAILSNYGFTEI